MPSLISWFSTIRKDHMKDRRDLHFPELSAESGGGPRGSALVGAALYLRPKFHILIAGMAS
jgi:hypothetical protein